MNKTLLKILMFGLLILFIISPFAGLASLMLVVLVSGFFFLLGDVFQAIIGGDTDAKKS
ncbi:MAG: hypothetical protein RMY16_04835 [Nostoc sp. DedQUE12b]|uniref:hypothetical protein n=1 Tax=unclassified Nostoc TaxID=2593658 RepID=UPI002AD363E2|nr:MULTISPECIES: hypothetical protein [unclassified Nostoc]MDZ7952030.1 hypothetical protein [Nostoc sp. DedQUE09]MDZ8084911.1 hypothetical protein [Nostoc sp. DedQUE12b]